MPRAWTRVASGDRMMTAKRILALLFCSLALMSSTAAMPPPVAWERWLPYAAGSMKQVDHGAWDEFLTRYLRIGHDGVHRIAYGNVTPEDRALLERYLATMAKVRVEDYDRPEQMAFWLNLYNATITAIVLDHYPIASVKDIAHSEPATAWDLKAAEVDGERMSLNDIEHRILRPIWRDPRIHYALTCAALGCPNLPPEPYTGARLEQQLSHGALTYINNPRCVGVNNGKLELSSLWRWNRDDFGASDLDVIRHLLAYATPSLAMLLQRFDRIDGDSFDWRLNDATQ
jgi:hypothetical protein